ncbi:MAG: GGDEF domain-containing protein [Bacillota bacterium]|nr:GGDEF domain-containing protein [Bacillota bacterium]
MFYIDRFNQIDLLIIVCFSFLIFVFTVASAKGRSLSRAGGTLFVIPLVFCVLSFLSSKTIVAETFLLLSDIYIIFVLFLLFLVKTDQARTIMQLVIYITSFVLLFLVYNSTAAINSIFKGRYMPAAYILIPLLFMYLFIRNKDQGRLLFWAGFYAFLSGLTSVISSQAFIQYLSLIMKALEFLYFFLFFHENIFKNAVRTAQKSSKQSPDLDRTINLEVKKRIFEIERSNEKLATIAKTDPMTKALNKTAILDVIDKHIETKPDSSFSILMFDIDNFKIINDSMGHITGDKCIKRLVLIAKSCIRDIDSLGRYGGDEFVIVLPNATSLQSSIIAERFRKKVAETANPHFTISVGIASYPADGTDVKGMIQAADECLYMSKAKGRNAISYKSR